MQISLNNNKKKKQLVTKKFFENFFEQKNVNVTLHFVADFCY